MKTIVNLTPHSIAVLDASNEVVLNLPSEGNARCKVEKTVIGSLNGFAVKKSVFGEIEGLHEPEDNTVYVVSAITAQAAKDRKDLYIVEDTVMDSSGRIIGCKSFGVI